MKGFISVLKVFSTSFLYIPHGSDESFFYSFYNRFHTSFISHMVQMKVSMYLVQGHFLIFFISHMVQMKEGRKTETWSLKTTFISHMVQMKEP